MSTLELGVVGNCAIASLIDRRGRHVWHGLGRLDGDPVFNALLGGNEPQGGFMEAAVAGGKEGRQRYLPNTAILETIVDGTSGTPAHRRLRAALPPLRPHVPPADAGAPARAGRRTAADHAPPAADLQLRRRSSRSVTSGSHHARFVGDNAVLRLTTDGSITYILHETEFSLDRPIT